MMWHEEDLWNVSVLQRVNLSNLVPFYISLTTGNKVTPEKLQSLSRTKIPCLLWNKNLNTVFTAYCPLDTS